MHTDAYSVMTRIRSLSSQASEPCLNDPPPTLADRCLADLDLVSTTFLP
jgi:hypothetical protein